MATKKTEVTDVAEARDIWKEMRVVNLPRPGNSETENFQFVGINGKFFQVPKGKAVEVPLPVYEVLKNSEILKDYAADVKANLANGSL